MLIGRKQQTGHVGGTRGIRRRGATTAALGALLLGLAGCNGDEAWSAFRSASTSGLRAGASAIAQGVIDGAFAIFELGADKHETDG